MASVTHSCLALVVAGSMLLSSGSARAADASVAPAAPAASPARDPQYREDLELFHDWLYRYGERPSVASVRRILARAKSDPKDAEALFWAGRCMWKGLASDTPVDGLAYIRRAAEMGELDAMAQWGGELWVGEDAGRDVQRGVSFLRKAVDRGNAYAMLSLGTGMCLGKPGVPHDPKEGERLMKESLEKGYFPAAHALAALYYERPDAAKNLEYGRRAASLGDTAAMRQLFSYFGQQTTPPLDAKIAEQNLVRGALWGDPVLMRELALAASEEKFGQYKDQYLSLRLLSKSAREGDALAPVFLAGARVRSGIEPERGRRMLEWLARFGEGEAQAQAKHTLGELYYSGTGVPQSRSRGRALIQQAADQGLPEAKRWLEAHQAPDPPEPAPATQPALSSREQLQAMIDDDEFRGWLYLMDDRPSPEAVHRMISRAQGARPSPRTLLWASIAVSHRWERSVDARQSIAWLEQAAKLGDLAAVAHYGSLLAGGANAPALQLPRDRAKGMELMTLAADRGEPLAELNLGIAWMTSEAGAARDLVKAQRHLLRAADGGVLRALAPLSAVYHELGNASNAKECQIRAALAGDELMTLSLIRSSAKDTAVYFAVRGALWGHPATTAWAAFLQSNDDDNLKKMLFRRAAAMGNIQAQTVLAAAHVTGELGIALDVDRGLAELEKHVASKPKSTEACWRLGRILFEGIHVPTNRKRGRELIEEAARNDHVAAREWVEKHANAGDQ